MLGHTIRISTYDEKQEKILNTVSSHDAMANNAQVNAKCAAIAYAALQQSVMKKTEPTINLNNDIAYSTPSSKVVKLSDAFDSKKAERFRESEFVGIEQEMFEEFSRFGKLVKAEIVRPEKRKLGAEIGAIFFEFESIKSSEICIKAMRGKKYEGRPVKLSFVEEEIFRNEIMPDWESSKNEEG